MTYGRVSEFCVGSINKSESVAGLAGSIASVFSKHIITACRTFRSMICVLIIITHRYPPQCHHNFHLQRDKVCCVHADPAEHGVVRRPRRLSHHLRLSAQVPKIWNGWFWQRYLPFRSFTNSLRANFIDYDNVIICSNDNLATDNGQVWTMILSH